MPWNVESGKAVDVMGRISFVDAEYSGKRQKARRELFLEEVEPVVPRRALLKVIEPPLERKPPDWEHVGIANLGLNTYISLHNKVVGHLRQTIKEEESWRCRVLDA